jgi:hypothetical protein
MIAKIATNLLTPPKQKSTLLVAPPKARRAAPRVRSRRAASKLRVGIVTPCPGVWDANGQLRVPHVESRLTNALLERFPESRVCIPVCPEMSSLCKNVLDVAPENVEALPALTSTIKAQKYYFQVRQAVRRFADSVDVLYVKLPHTLPRALKGINKPKLVHVIGDAREVVRVSSDYRGAASCGTSWAPTKAAWSFRRASTSTRCSPTAPAAWATCRGCCSSATCVRKRACSTCCRPSTRFAPPGP